MKAQSKKPDESALGEPVDATPAKLPQAVTLKGAYGSIERLNAERHGASLWQAFEGHDDIWTYMKNGPFPAREDFFAYLRERESQDDPYMYAVLDKNGEALGLASLMRINPPMRTIEVGYILYAPALQRTPLGTEAQYLLMKYAFEGLGYRRYEWKCNALNEKSCAAALRYGFTFEGVFRQAEIIKGRNRDTAWFSILDSEWPATKRNFERWLAPDNFDAEGTQKTPLAGKR